MDFNELRNEILDIVYNFIDPQYWLDKSGKIITDPVETNVNLFDDFHFDEFLVKHSNELTHIQQELGQTLISTIDKHDHLFDELPLEKLLEHPQFLEIRKAAVNFFNAFPANVRRDVVKKWKDTYDAILNGNPYVE